MDKVKKMQIQTTLILRDTRTMFLNAKTLEEAVEIFRKTFPSSRTYWTHIRRHAIPERVKKELGTTNWKKARALSRKLMGYQKEYTLKFLQTLAHVDKVALLISPKAEFNRIVIYSSKNRLAIFLEPTGEVVTAHELDIFKNWGEWKHNRLYEKGELIEEILLNEDIQRESREIRRLLERLGRGS
ncbi:hypothetical protein [Desulfurobacterium sp.]|uniref:hypothetical protein n=1 Tax=Desulfurobacterium sp. TaxID=2004706 RepID=UPI002626418B|nr:hypothetical protein [Desulfurobacterium sp.]